MTNRPKGVPVDDVDVYDFGAVQHRAIEPTVPHWHNNLEIAYTNRGSMTCRIGGASITLPRGRLAVLWGARLHEWTEVEEGSTRTFVDVPLCWFFDWHYPASFVQRILGGEVVFEPDARQSDLDELLLNRWTTDLNHGVAALRQVVSLEIRARLWRLAISVSSRESVSEGMSIVSRPAGELTKVASMSSYVAEHYREPVTVKEIAASVGLHPNYAMALFRKRAGLTLMDYVTEQRISHAKLLLSTTDTGILDTAFHSGFGSASRFYRAFRRLCGQTPSAYRRASRGGM